MGPRVFENLWRTLHEPRPVTVTMVFVYVTAMVMGVLNLWGLQSPLFPVLPPLGLVESVVLLGAGIIGTYSSWVGKWYLERGAVIIFGGLGALYGLLLMVDYFWATPLVEPRTGISTTLIMALTAWVALAVTRWIRVSSQPYAPGKGPQSILTAEIIVKKLIEETKPTPPEGSDGGT